MRIPVSWLRDHVALPEGCAAPTVAQIADAFVQAGLEVEAVHQLGPVSGPLVVGRVQEIEGSDVAIKGSGGPTCLTLPLHRDAA